MLRNATGVGGIHTSVTKVYDPTLLVNITRGGGVQISRKKKHYVNT